MVDFHHDVPQSPEEEEESSYRFVTAEERQYVDQLCTADDLDEPLMVHWVEQHKKDRKSSHPRLLVISKYRLWILKSKSKFSYRCLGLLKSYALLELSSVTYESTAAAFVMTFLEPHHAAFLHDEGESEQLAFVPDTFHRETIARCIQRTVVQLTSSFPLAFRPRFDLPLTWKETSDQSSQPSPAEVLETLVTMYKAFCNFLHTPFRSSVMDRVETLMDWTTSPVLLKPNAADNNVLHEEERGGHQPEKEDLEHHLNNNLVEPQRGARTTALDLELDFMWCFEQCQNPPVHSKDFEAFVRALRTCSLFHCFVLRDFHLSDRGAKALFQTLRWNGSITSVVLSKVSFSREGLRQLRFAVGHRDSALEPPQSPSLHWSSLATSVSSSFSGTYISSWKNKTKSKKKSHSASLVSPHLVGPRLSSLKPQPDRRFSALPTSCLLELDLSQNRLTKDMATILASSLKEFHQGLHVLSLEHCHLSSLSMLSILHVCQLPPWTSHLRELNLNFNLLNTREATAALAKYLTCTFVLKRLYLAKTRCDTDLILDAIQRNSVLSQSSLESLNLSYNSLSVRASQILFQICSKSAHLSQLQLCGIRRPWSSLACQALLAPGSGSSLPSSPSPSSSSRLFSSKASPDSSTNNRNDRSMESRKDTDRDESDHPPSRRLDMSENDFVGKKGAILCRSIRDTSPLMTRHALIWNDCKFSPDSFAHMLEALATCASLEVLSFQRLYLATSVFRRVLQSLSFSSDDSNDDTTMIMKSHAGVVHRTAQAMFSLLCHHSTSAGDALVDISGSKFSVCFPVRDGPELVELYLNGSFVHKRQAPPPQDSEHQKHEHEHHPVILMAAIAALEWNRHLEILDISGNHGGDDVARILSQVLPTNTILKILLWDENDISLSGFERFCVGLEHNHTLLFMPVPIHDLRRILDHAKAPREDLFSILGTIYESIERNQMQYQTEEAEDELSSLPAAASKSLSIRYQSLRKDNPFTTLQNLNPTITTADPNPTNPFSLDEWMRNNGRAGADYPSITATKMYSMTSSTMKNPWKAWKDSIQ